MLSSTFLVTKELTIEITDSYPIWRLLKGHFDTELLRRTLAGLLLQIGDNKDRATPRALTNRGGFQSVFKFTPETTQKTRRVWGRWVNPYCDTWGCLNKRTQGELCDTCTSIPYGKPRSGTSYGYQTISTVGTPEATRHPIDVKHEPTELDTTHSHFQLQRPKSGTHKHNIKVHKKRPCKALQPRGVFANLFTCKKTHKALNDRSHFQSHHKPNSGTLWPLTSTVSERTPLATRRSHTDARASLGPFAYRSHLQSLQRREDIVGFRGKFRVNQGGLLYTALQGFRGNHRNTIQ